MALDHYRARRHFDRTPEPRGDDGGENRRETGRRFVIQKHAASRLHYDLRLEHEGVLLSWAVPRGPSLDPDERRLAVRVEDHPLEYGDFEGVIPEGEYGGGAVLVWDRGGWTPEDDPESALGRGKLSFTLDGRRLSGRWTLVRMDRDAGENGRNWLLVKSRDEGAAPGRGAAELGEESVVTGRTLEEIRRHRDRVWTSEGEVAGPGPEPRSGAEGRGFDPAETIESPSAAPDPAELQGAREASLPDRPRPALATRVERPPGGNDWVHEIKFDGYRILARAGADGVRLLTRNGNDWTGRFGRIARAVGKLSVGEAVIDGEVVALQDDGTTSFQRLQERIAADDEGGIVYFAFDLLHLDGYDLRGVPLVRRKEALAAVLAGRRSTGADDADATASDDGTAPLRYSDHVRGRGGDFFRQACVHALEGVVSKRADGRYRAGRSREWRKSKCIDRQEFVVCGFTDPSGARSGFGSLLLGYRDDGGALRYAGRVGTGFTERALSHLRDTLDELSRDDDDPPFDEPGPSERGLHWVAPVLVVEVEFTEWTRDGVLRHPSFRGVRDDVDPDEVGRERVDGRSGGPRGGPPRPRGEPRDERDPRDEDGGGRRDEVRFRGVRVTHPDRVLYPERGITKRRLAEYYELVGGSLLQLSAERPLTLVRCPRGREASCFYQKHVNESVPDEVRTVEIEESDGVGTYMYVDSVEGLVGLVQMGTLELHPWGARIDRLDRPDRLVFDLDPGPGVGWDGVVEAARELRARLDELGLRSFPMTTGGKGLHVTLPLVRRNGWDEVKAFARGVAEAMAREAPERYVATAAKSRRGGRIYVDYLRNDRGATAVAPYSTRARPGAPVAVPLRWDELGPGVRSDRYGVDTVARRLAALDADPWEGFRAVRQSITAERARAVEAGR